MRARMKPGVRPIVLPGCILVPEYPTYWNVPDNASAAVELLAKDGQLEYEPSFARGAGGTFAPALALTPVTPDADAPKPFGRKGARK
jgi:hypothetical protein